MILISAMLFPGMLLSGFAGSFRGQVEEPVTTSIAEDPEGAENWILGRPTAIRGLGVSIVPLVSESGIAEKEVLNMFGSGGSRYGRSQGYSKNILFVNRDSSEMRWLFDDVGQIINTVGQLPREKHYLSRNEESATKFMLYDVNLKDTDNDGVITSDDASSLAYSLPDGSGFEVLLEGYEKILSTTFEEDETISIMYQISGSGYISRFSLNPAAESSKQAFPGLGK